MATGGCGTLVNQQTDSAGINGASWTKGTRDWRDTHPLPQTSLLRSSGKGRAFINRTMDACHVGDNVVEVLCVLVGQNGSHRLSTASPQVAPSIDVCHNKARIETMELHHQKREQQWLRG